MKMMTGRSSLTAAAAWGGVSVDLLFSAVAADSGAPALQASSGAINQRSCIPRRIRVRVIMMPSCHLRNWKS
jgi:hypothetical protein